MEIMENIDKHMELIIDSNSYEEYCIKCNLNGLTELSFATYTKFCEKPWIKELKIQNFQYCMKCDNIKDEHNSSGFTKVEDDKFKIKITVQDRIDEVCHNCGRELE